MGCVTTYFCDWCKTTVTGERELIDIHQQHNRPPTAEIRFAGVVLKVLLHGIEDPSDEDSFGVYKLCKCCHQRLLTALTLLTVGDASVEAVQ